MPDKKTEQDKSPIGYMLDADYVVKLRQLCSELHNGTDRERDYGHRLWLILNNLIPVEE